MTPMRQLLVQNSLAVDTDGEYLENWGQADSLRVMLLM